MNLKMLQKSLLLWPKEGWELRGRRWLDLGRHTEGMRRYAEREVKPCVVTYAYALT